MQVEICKFVGFEVKIPTRLQLESSRRGGRIRPPQVLNLSLVLDSPSAQAFDLSWAGEKTAVAPSFARSLP